MSDVLLAPVTSRVVGFRSTSLLSVSAREIEVLQCIARGLTSHQIAEELYISQHTVISHRKSLLLKLDAKNTAHLVMLGVKKGWL